MESMKLTINGEPQVSSAETLGALVETLGMKPDRVAIELNREIVPREQWPQTPLHDGDRLEIVHFVGGGSDAQPFVNCHPERSEGSAFSSQRHTHCKFGNPFLNLLT
jgi:thiamine biosynthesis protein ThiS